MENLAPKDGVSIYFSYAKNDDQFDYSIVNVLFSELKDRYNVVMDKENLVYGQVISDFIKVLGKGDLILLFLSENYFKSPFCMFEMLEISRNSKNDLRSFSGRILPIPIQEINFHSKLVLGQYLDHWIDHTKDLAQFVVNRIDDISGHDFRDYEISRDIKQNFSTLSHKIREVYAPDIGLLTDNSFRIVKDAIDKRIEKLKKDPKSPTDSPPDAQ